MLVYNENEDIYKISLYQKTKKGYKHKFPLVYFNETLKIFVDYIASTINKNNFKDFDFNFSLKLTQSINKITNNY